MKTNRSACILFIALLTVAIGFSACTSTSVSPTNTVNPSIYQTQSTMYGKTYAQWAAEWWKWNLQFDCAHFPLSDTTGARQSQSQSGSVYFLAGKRGHTLNVTVPAGVSLFLPLVTFETEDPCVDNGTPAQGETVEHFLTGIAQKNTNAIDQLSLTIDGVVIDSIPAYKVISPLFTIAANADLANCYDGCINGTAQPFVAGGYFFMLKPLSAGKHTIHRVGGASTLFPFLYDITYTVTQQ